MEGLTISQQVKFEMAAADWLGPKTRAALQECSVRFAASAVHDQIKQREVMLSAQYGTPIKISPLDPKTDAAIAHALMSATQMNICEPLTAKISNKSIREQRKALRARRW